MNASTENPDITSPDTPATADVYLYEDYRRFLRDRFAELQRLDPGFSQRGLARKAGFANPGFFNEVIKGRRRLSPAAAMKMSVGLSLSTGEAEYFSALVEYAETRETGARLAAGERLQAIKDRKSAPPPEALPAAPERLRDLILELQQEWVLKAAGLNLPSPREGEAVPDITIDQPALRRLLEKLGSLASHQGK